MPFPYTFPFEFDEATAATVTTGDVTSITAETITIEGSIVTNDNCTRRGFCYIEGDSGTPTTGDSVEYEDGFFNSGSYSIVISSLTKLTSYRVRAYAINSVDTSYGDTITVVTSDYPLWPLYTGDLIVRVAFVDTPLETSPNWVDITSDVRELHTQRGRNHDLDRMESGTLDIVINNTSGDYWPDNTGGAYTPNVDIMKKVNIRTTYLDTTYDIFTGYIESYAPSYLGAGGYGSLMTLHCVGALGKIIALQALNNAGYAAEQSGTRVDNVLDSCSWPAAWATLDAGQDLFQATGALVNVNALDHLQQCQESELSLLYEDTDGTLIYEDRSHRTASPHTVSQATFGEGVGEIVYADFKYVLDEVLLFNDARITRTGGTEQTLTNSTSITNYGKRTFAKSTLHNTDTQAAHLALYVIARYSDVAGRVDSIEITPDDSDKWTQVMSRKISDRVTVKNTDAGVDGDYFIEGIQHDWDFVNGTYSTKFSLSDATLYLNPPDAQTEILRPNAAGDANVLPTDSGAGSANNYTHVDEAVASDADYVYAEFPGGGRDLYNLSDLSYTSATITSVIVTVRAKKTGTGTAWTSIRTNSTNYDSAITLTSDYALHSTTYTTNPNTSVAWTVDEVNALQAGVNLNPTGAGVLEYCSQVYVTVNFVPGW